MIEIPLTGGLVAIIDKEDYPLISQYKWSAHRSGRKYYAATNVKVGDRYRYKAMHRMIMGVEDPLIIVDHIDHNGLNNQKENLRTCSKKDNNRYQRKPLHSKSKYKGVYKVPNYDKYRARIRTSNGRLFLGYFNSAEEAAKAYNEAAIKYHGEFACLNVINE